MLLRRDLLIGAGCAVAAGAGAALKPRRHVSLLGEHETLASIIPTNFDGWRSEDVGDPMAINARGNTLERLYTQMVTRLYINDEVRASVLMLLAYGGSQTDELQLHRPEVCYPAFGFSLLKNEVTALSIGRGVNLPGRRILADNGERREYVTYWTRMGEYLPVSGGQQREDRFRIAMHGVIPDGLLSRFSMTSDAPGAWGEIETFVAALVKAVPVQHRRVLIGTERANAMLAQA